MRQAGGCAQAAADRRLRGRWLLAGRLHGRLRVAVRGEPLHVYLWDRQLVRDVVRVLDGRSLGETLAERRLLAEDLGQARVDALVPGVQALPEGVHHANLQRERRVRNVRAETEDSRVRAELSLTEPRKTERESAREFSLSNSIVLITKLIYT